MAFLSWALGLGFPGFAQDFPLPEDVLLGLVEAAVHACALDHVARAAAGHQVGGILLAFARARNHEINGHDQRVLEAGPSVESTIAAAVLIAFKNFQAFVECYRAVYHGHSG